MGYHAREGTNALSDEGHIAGNKGREWITAIPEEEFCVSEEEACSCNSGEFFHGFVVEVSYPDGNGVKRGVANHAVVSEVLGGSCFDSNGEGEVDGGCCSKGRDFVTKI